MKEFIRKWLDLVCHVQGGSSVLQLNCQKDEKDKNSQKLVLWHISKTWHLNKTAVDQYNSNDGHFVSPTSKMAKKVFISAIMTSFYMFTYTPSFDEHIYFFSILKVYVSSNCQNSELFSLHLKGMKTFKCKCDVLKCINLHKIYLRFFFFFKIYNIASMVLVPQNIVCIVWFVFAL